MRDEFGIDPARIAASGSSAGAGIALWVGFHDDLADPGSPDPVAPPVDPRDLPGRRRRPDLVRPAVHQAGRRRPGARAPGARAVLRPGRLRPRYAQGPPASSRTPRRSTTPRPATRRSSSSTPSRTSRCPPTPSPGQGIHHPRFGAALKAKLDPLGVECVVRHARDFPDDDDPDEAMFREMVEFFARHLRKSEAIREVP